VFLGYAVPDELEEDALFITVAEVSEFDATRPGGLQISK
jgi:hypothetical protein